jgi:hypothetical protein
LSADDRAIVAKFEELIKKARVDMLKLLEQDKQAEHG